MSLFFNLKHFQYFRYIKLNIILTSEIEIIIMKIFGNFFRWTVYATCLRSGICCKRVSTWRASSGDQARTSASSSRIYLWDIFLGNALFIMICNAYAYPWLSLSHNTISPFEFSYDFLLSKSYMWLAFLQWVRMIAEQFNHLDVYRWRLNWQARYIKPRACCLAPDRFHGATYFWVQSFLVWCRYKSSKFRTSVYFFSFI